MLNQAVIVGRVVVVPHKKNNKKIMTIAVPRSYKSTNGDYETDFVECVIWKRIQKQLGNYLREGDFVSIKGRLESDNDNLKLVAEKVAYLSATNQNQ